MSILKTISKVLFIGGIFAIVAGVFMSTLNITQAAGSGNSNGIEVLSPVSAGSRGEEWDIFLDDEPVVQLFVNAPTHNAPAGTYDKKNVPVSFRVDWAACANKLSTARVIVRYDANGGKHSNLTGTSSSNWVNLYNNTFSDDGTCGGGYMCVPTRSVTRNFDLSELKDGACDTTLQFIAKWDWTDCGTDADPTPNSIIDAGDSVFQKGQVHVINLWLNFSCPTPTPEPTATPTPEPEKKDDKGNFSISKTDNRTTVKPGEVSTYKITVKNNRDNDMTDIKITDLVPQYLTPISASPTASIADEKNRKIVWDHQTISAHAEVTFAFKAKIDQNAPNDFVLHNVVNINGDGVKASAADSTTVKTATAMVIEKTQPVPVAAKTGTSEVATMILSISGSIATAGTLIAKKIIK